MPLSSYFTDDDGDALTLTGTYSFNGGAAIAIPSGIFTVLSSLTINCASTSLADVGTYNIALTVSDS